MVQNLISNLKLVPTLFSHNLVRCLINHVHQKDRFLHRAADKSLKSLIQAMEAHPQTLATILPCLLGGNGSYNFDKVTNTKTVERLLSFVDESNAEPVIEVLSDLVVSVERLVICFLATSILHQADFE